MVLYDIKNDNIELYELVQKASELQDVDCEADIIADTAELLLAEGYEAAERLALCVLSMRADEKAIDEEIARLGRVKRQRRASERVAKSALLAYLHELGKDDIVTTRVKIAIRENPGAVVVDDIKLLPSGCVVVPSPVPARAEIKARIESGEDVPGAHIVKTWRVDIR